MKLKELHDIYDVINKEFQRVSEHTDTCKRFKATVDVIERYQQASEAEKAFIDTIFYTLTGKDFVMLIKDFLEGFQGQHRLCELITRTIGLADEMKSARWR